VARNKGKKPVPEQAVIDYRHEDAKRKNIPPAGLAAQGKIREKPKIQYEDDNPYSPLICSIGQGSVVYIMSSLRSVTDA
jgi:hypothetical protein